MSRHSLAMLLTVSIAPAVFGAVQRTFVSTAGVDTNPCSLTQPCRTFTAAIGQTLSGGEVYVLDSGGYGPVVIHASVSIRAEGVAAGVSAPSGIAIDVAAGASDVVTLSGLSINGVGGTTGVAFDSGAALHLDRLMVANFTVEGILVATSGRVTLTDSVVRDNTGNGGLVVQSFGNPADVAVGRTRFEHNAFGIAVFDSGRVIARDTVASGNQEGFDIGGAGNYAIEVTLESCVVAGNAIGIDIWKNGSGAHVPTVRMANVTVSGNYARGLFPSIGVAILSFGNNQIYGNGIDGAPTGAIAQE